MGSMQGSGSDWAQRRLSEEWSVLGRKWGVLGEERSVLGRKNDTIKGQGMKNAQCDRASRLNCTW